MSNVIAIRTRPIFGRKRRPARSWALPMLLSVPLLATALYFGNTSPVMPALASPPPLACDGKDAIRHPAAGRGPADTAPAACLP